MLDRPQNAGTGAQARQTLSAAHRPREPVLNAKRNHRTAAVRIGTRALTRTLHPMRPPHGGGSTGGVGLRYARYQYLVTPEAKAEG